MTNEILEFTAIIPLAGILILATVYDLRYQKIPNKLTYPSMMMALVYYGTTRGLDGLMFSAGGLALGIAILLLPYSMGVMGAGDVKLLGAVGGILGAKGVFASFLFTGVVGGLYALILIVFKRGLSKGMILRSAITVKTLAVTGQFIPIPSPEEENKPRLCYGVAIALGTMIYVFVETTGGKIPL